MEFEGQINQNNWCSHSPRLGTGWARALANHQEPLAEFEFSCLQKWCECLDLREFLNRGVWRCNPSHFYCFSSFLRLFVLRPGCEDDLPPSETDSTLYHANINHHSDVITSHHTMTKALVIMVPTRRFLDLPDAREEDSLTRSPQKQATKHEEMASWHGVTMHSL